MPRAEPGAGNRYAFSPNAASPRAASSASLITVVVPEVILTSGGGAPASPVHQRWFDIE
jgi:hypothetical protein